MFSQQKKEKIEYVDEFRKISAREKLPIVTNTLNDFFDEDTNKEANNKFIRLRKQPIVPHWPDISHQEFVLANEYVEEGVDNRKTEEFEKYHNEDLRIRDDVEKFKRLSKENCAVEDERKQYKFYYRNASPPKKISEESTGKQAYKLAILTPGVTQSVENPPGYEMFDKNYTAAGKYDFRLINKRRAEEYLENKERNYDMEKQDIQVALLQKKYENLRDIHDIMKMDQFDMVHKDFTYNLQVNDEELVQFNKLIMSKFIYKSETKSSSAVSADVEFFRDIGLPSRDLAAFTEQVYKKEKKDQMEEQMKEDAHLLYLLKEHELNINKAHLNFCDIANITMRRMTGLNAYLCIRSEKVTKAQFDKLIQRLNRYKKQQKEQGKKTTDTGMGTQENLQSTEAQEKLSESSNPNKNPTWQLTNEIMGLRKEAALINQRNKKGLFSIRENAFKKELYHRMSVLLKKLYAKIVRDPSNYPISMMQSLIEADQLDDLLTEEGKNGKLLWFVADCFEEIAMNLPKEDNIRNLLRKKNVAEPKVIFFKGQKQIKQDTIRSVNLFTYRDKNANQPAQRDKKSRKSTTPLKSAKSTVSKSPIKSTAQKKPIGQQDANRTATPTKFWRK